MSAPPERLAYIKQQTNNLFDDATINATWDNNAPRYPNDDIIQTATIVDLLNSRYLTLSTQVDYQMNQERESASQRAVALWRLLERWQAQLDGELGRLGASARIGRTRRHKRHWRQHHD